MSQRSALPDPVPVDLPLEQRLAIAVERYGADGAMSRALSLVAGHDESADFLLFVGGDHAQGILGGAPTLYWPELWGLRALLYVWDDDVWDDSAADLVVGTLRNPAWRVREMGARVIAARDLPATAELAEMLGDKVARVRAAAARALATVGVAADEPRLRALLKDPDLAVRRATQQSIDVLRSRFPRD